MTVIWNESALAELAELFLTVQDKRALRAAVHEADTLLRVDPERKGKSWFAGQLDPEILDSLAARMGVVPEVVRAMKLGPIELFFTSQPMDYQVFVWKLRLRSRPSV